MKKKVKLPRKRMHANCGGEIEFIPLEGSVQTLVRCKKCKEQEMRDFLTKTNS